MIKITNYSYAKQIEIREFILKNIKRELLNVEKNVLERITEDLDNIEESYIKTNGVFLVAYDDEKNKIIGTIALKYEKKAVMLKRFYVDKDYRNRKIGYLLYCELEKKIKEKNIKEVYLVSGKELIKARDFYIRNGWKVEEKNPGIYVRDGAYLYKKIY